MRCNRSAWRATRNRRRWLRRRAALAFDLRSGGNRRRVTPVAPTTLVVEQHLRRHLRAVNRSVGPDAAVVEAERSVLLVALEISRSARSAVVGMQRGRHVRACRQADQSIQKWTCPIRLPEPMITTMPMRRNGAGRADFWRSATLRQHFTTTPRRVVITCVTVPGCGCGPVDGDAGESAPKGDGGSSISVSRSDDAATGSSSEPAIHRGWPASKLSANLLFSRTTIHLCSFEVPMALRITACSQAS